MKVIFSHSLPFSLAHGGQQTLIEALMRELAELGVEVEPERWWDPAQTGDVLHYVQRPQVVTVVLAKQKGRITVMTENFDVVASESKTRLWVRAVMTRVGRRISRGYNDRLRFYDDLDALAYVVPHEWEVVRQIYDLPAEKGTIIPHGLEPKAIEALGAAQAEGEYLVSVGSICARKNTVLLAESASRAKVPVVFLGKPFSEDDEYYLKFRSLVDGKYVSYAGYTTEAEKYDLLRGARGFALLSVGESGCIAVYEAAAAGLPLLLSDLPWASSGYPASERLRLVRLGSVAEIAGALGRFYEEAHRGETMTFPVGSWREVAARYRDLYERLLREGRGSV